jgi:predicted HAD superfamily Cof-like phosphohydrolase
MDRQLKVKIVRKVPVSTYKFNNYFKGFEKIDTVRKIFGEKTEEVLNNIKVEFAGFRGYMGVSHIDGHLLVSAAYLKDGDIVDIYLDIIHELVHVKQFMEGKELFDNTFRYTDRPSEIEAYRITVDEARKLGLSDERICEYLKTEWMSDDDFTRLAKILNVRCSRS